MTMACPEAEKYKCADKKKKSLLHLQLVKQLRQCIEDVFVFFPSPGGWGKIKL